MKYIRYEFSFLNELLEKGKPSERVGRKATGLSSPQVNTTAGLPGKPSTFQSCCASEWSDEKVFITYFADYDTDKNGVPDDLSCFISVAAAGSDRQSWNLWRETRGCELAIIFVVVFLAYLGKVVFVGYRRNGGLV